MTGRPPADDLVTAASGRPDAVRFFDTTVEDYDTKHYGRATRTFMTVRQERVLACVDALGLPPGSRVLDAGCGPGHLLRALADREFRVTGMDAALGMVQASRQRLRDPAPAFPARFGRASIDVLPYASRTFDLVCSTGVIEYLQEDTAVLAELFRVLAPGGHLVLPVTNLWSPVNWLDPVVEFLKRRAVIRRPFNAVWERLGHGPVLPRHFRVRRHRPGRFRAALRTAGFTIEDELYFHFLPWPRPLDRLLPGPSRALGRRMERWGRSRAGVLGEGFLVLARRPAQPSPSSA